LRNALCQTFFLLFLVCVGVFENRMLRGIFEPKREEVAGGWRKLHNEELQPSQNIMIFK